MIKNMSISKILKHICVCGLALVTLSSLGAAYQSNMSSNTKAQASTNQMFHQSASQRRRYFRRIVAPFKRGSHTYRNPFSHKKAQFLKHPTQVNNAPQFIRVNKPNKYGRSISFYPSGLIVNQNGHVYCRGHFVGFLNTSKAANKMMTTHPYEKHGIYGECMFPRSTGMVYDIKLGSINGHTISIMVPRKLQAKYNTLVSRNDRYHLSKVWNSYHNRSNRDISEAGHNYNGYGARVRYWLKYYVNQARAQYHLKPFKYNARLQAISNARAIQVTIAYKTQPKIYCQEQQQGNDTDSDNWVHGKDASNSAVDDSGFLDLVPFTNNDKSNIIAENAGNGYIGKSSENDMSYHAVMDSKTPRQLAYSTVVGLMDHDNASHNGHRQNILTPKARQAGFGIKLYRTKSGQLGCSYVFDIN